MKLYKVLAIIGLASLSLASCQKKYADYEPAAKETGAQFYFSNSMQTYVKLTPDTESIDIEVLRIDDAAAGTASISVSDESKVIVAEGEKTISVPFAQGAKKATFSIPVDMNEIEYGDKFSLILKITAEITQYAISEITIVAEFPEPWISLGKGIFTEDFWYEDSAEVEIQQNQVAPNQFRIVDPFSVMAKTMSGDEEDYAYLYFRVLKPGEVISDITVTENDLVYFSSTSTGYYYSNYDAIIWIHHPVVFSKTHTEDFWLHNVVLSYQENGLPGIIQLAPWYYMDSVGGWNLSQEDDIVSIIFPGVILKDYSVETEFAGMFTDINENVFGVANVNFGEDVDGGKAVLVPGKDPTVGLQLIKNDDESVIDVIGAEIKLQLPEDAETGSYTIVVVSIGDGEIQETDYCTFFYQASEVELDWDWLVGEWVEQDSEGDPYSIIISKKDETTAIFTNIWDNGADIEGTVDFAAGTVTFKSPTNLGDFYGGFLMMAHLGESEYDKEDIVAKLSPSGIIISNIGFYVVGGNYDGYDLGPDYITISR